MQEEGERSQKQSLLTGALQEKSDRYLGKFGPSCRNNKIQGVIKTNRNNYNEDIHGGQVKSDDEPVEEKVPSLGTMINNNWEPGSRELPAALTHLTLNTKSKHISRIIGA